MALPLLPLQSPALVPNPSGRPLSHSPHKSQNLLVSPNPRNGLHEPQTSLSNSRSRPQYELSRFSSAESHFNSRTWALPISSKTLPCPESASIPHRPLPSALDATSIQVSRPQTSHSDGQGPVSNSLCSGPHSSIHSTSENTLVDEPEPYMGLGSAVLLSSSRPVSQRAHGVHRHVTLRRYIRALLPISRSIPVAGIPIDRWPEAAEGILPFLDLTDEKIQIALPYFGSVGYTHMQVTARVLDKYRERGSVTSELRTDESIQQDYTISSASTSNTFIKRNSCRTPGSLLQRQRLEVGRFPDVHGKISGRDQNIVTRKPRVIDGGVGRTPEPMRPLGAGMERPNEQYREGL